MRPVGLHIHFTTKPRHRFSLQWQWHGLTLHPPSPLPLDPRTCLVWFTLPAHCLSPPLPVCCCVPQDLGNPSCEGGKSPDVKATLSHMLQRLGERIKDLGVYAI